MRRLFKLVFISCLVLTFLFLFNPTDASAQRGILEGSLFLDGQPVNKAQIEMVSLGSGKKLKMKTPHGWKKLAKSLTACLIQLVIFLSTVNQKAD